MAKSLAGMVCLVTGATRGLGRGIAVQLGQAGATVYITGRTLKRTDGYVGSLEDTAKDIVSRGGVCVPVQCDHTKDDQVVAVFDQIKREQDGRLDILVNNAYTAVKAVFESVGRPFWELDDNMWDMVNNVGLRNHYQCTVYAARMMTPRKQGLIVNMSSFGGLIYLFNIPYGVGKAAVDRMTADCSIELRKHNVAMVSLWPGPVKTEETAKMVDEAHTQGGDTQGGISAERVERLFGNAESPEFSGKVIVALAQDRNLMQKSGRTLLAADMGIEYGVQDIDGRSIRSMRSLPYILNSYGWKRLARIAPEFIRIPYFILTLKGSKF